MFADPAEGILSINFELWDNAIYFDLYQVACLWNELEPPTSVTSFHLLETDSQSVSATYQDLVRSLQYGVLPYEPHITQEAFLEGKYERAVVSRGDLLELAKKQGMNPLFLFPELRHEIDSVREKEDVAEKPFPTANSRHANLYRIPPIDKRGKPGTKRGPYEEHLWQFLWSYFNIDTEGHLETFEQEPLSDLRKHFKAFCKNERKNCKIPVRSSLESAIKDLRCQIVFHVEKYGNPLA